MKPRLWLLAIVLASIPLYLWQQRAPSSATAGAAHGTTARPPSPLLMGAGSCAAAACHNGNFVNGNNGSEYTTWITRDRHAKAYEVLYDERSERIQKNLGRKTPAHKDQRCLHCHVYPDLDVGLEQKAPYFRSDGVSCESCHGPAGNWLTDHYSTAWKSKGLKEKLALGMKDTQTILGRSQLCVECHVGTPGKDIDHDLIAAGHPRLSFEFTAFHAFMPHHWPDSKDRDPTQSRRGQVDFEARAWVTGQLVTAQAALELLADRAGDEKKPWPEFAEHDCASCHHDLQAASERQQRQAPGKAAKLLPWAGWYRSMTPPALKAIKGNDQLLQELTMTLKTGWTNQTDRGAIAGQAKQAARQLKSLLGKIDHNLLGRLGPDELFEMLNVNGPNGNQSWDDTAQRYLALAALHRSHIDMKVPVSPQLRAALRGLGEKLDFSKEDGSARSLAPAAVRQRVKGL